MNTRYYNSDNGFTVAVVQNPDNKERLFTAILYTPLQPEKGMLLTVERGKWVENKKYGRQYKISSFYVKEPESKAGIEKYLASGIIKGIGPTMAKRIVSMFGEKALDVLDADPSKLLEISGIGKLSVEKIAASWQDKRAVARVLSALCNLGLTLALATKVYKQFGGCSAVEVIKQNPYVLTEVYGVGFIRADEIAQKLSFDIRSEYRMKAGILYALKMAKEKGHCYLPRGTLTTDVRPFLNIEDEYIEQAIDTMIQTSQLIKHNENIYLPELCQAENECRKKLISLSYGKGIQEEIPTSSLADHTYLTEEQHNAIFCALKNPVTVITGLPGTGKTTATKALIQILALLNIKYALCTPTGKASKRLEQLTGHEAKTIHRLLEYHPQFGFQKNSETPLDYDYIIIDEASMIDILLLSNLLDALKEGARLVLIGDVNQLPSVGPGNVLNDLIRSNICPVKMLTRIHRQAANSGIIQAAHTINRGLRPHLSHIIEDDAVALFHNDTDEIRNAVIQAINESGFTPQDIQLLTPMKKGPLGTAELNKALQALMNNNAKAKAPRLRGYYPGDRVIHLINNYKKDIFNGELGYVVSVDPEDASLVVAYDEKEVHYDYDELDEINLAYAMTVHKAQGSQFPCVILVLHGSHYVMLKRQLFYTAVTRAEKKLIIIGTTKSLAIAVNNNQEILRYSSLF